MTSCPSCAAGLIEDFDIVENEHGIFNLGICCRCLSILNLTAHALAAEKSQFEIQKAAHYESSAISAPDLQREVAANSENISNLLRLTNSSAAGATFLDFGAGRGCASIAAALVFSKVFSVDLDTKLLEGTVRRYPQLKNIKAVSTLDAVDGEIDFFYAWHAIEHIPKPSIFFSDLKPRLSAGAALAIQVPLFRPEFVIDCHYAFYSNASLRRLADVWGLTTLDVVVDTKLSFITLLARKSSAENWRA